MIKIKIDNNRLRKKCKVFKAMHGMTYKEMAEFAEINLDSFYAWLYGKYDFGEEKAILLDQILNDLHEEMSEN